jgi:LAO/AO transport system kinase
LLKIAGAGDELQGIKRGIIEMSDSLLITKADGENASKAKIASADFKQTMHFLPPKISGWIPKVESCSSLTGEGLENVFEILEEYNRQISANSFFKTKRQNQNLYWFNKTIQDNLLSYFLENKKVQKELELLQELVLNEKKSPHVAANNLVDWIKRESNHF